MLHLNHPEGTVYPSGLSIGHGKSAKYVVLCVPLPFWWVLRMRLSVNWCMPPSVRSWTWWLVKDAACGGCGERDAVARAYSNTTGLGAFGAYTHCIRCRLKGFD